MSKIIVLGIDKKPIELLQKGYIFCKLYNPKNPTDYIFINRKWKGEIISYNKNSIFNKDRDCGYCLKIQKEHNPNLYSYLKEMLSIDELPK